MREIAGGFFFKFKIQILSLEGGSPWSRGVLLGPGGVCLVRGGLLIRHLPAPMTTDALFLKL